MQERWLHAGIQPLALQAAILKRSRAVEVQAYSLRDDGAGLPGSARTARELVRSCSATTVFFSDPLFKSDSKKVRCLLRLFIFTVTGQQQ